MRNPDALAGATPEDAARIKARADADDEAKYGPMPDPKTDPEAWRFRTFKKLYRQFIIIITKHSGANAAAYTNNAFVKKFFNDLMSARADLMGASSESILKAFEDEYVLHRRERDAIASEARAQADAYLASKPNPLTAPRPKRIEGPQVTRKIGETMSAFMQAIQDPQDPREGDAPVNPPPPEPPFSPEPPEPPSEPAPEPPVVPPSRWQDDESKLNTFRKAVIAEINRVYGEGAVSPQGVNEIVRAALHGTLDEWTGSGSEALARIKDYLKSQNSVVEASNLSENGASGIYVPEPPKQRNGEADSAVSDDVKPRASDEVKMVKSAAAYSRPASVVQSRYEIPVTEATAGWLVQVQQAEIFLKSGLLPASIRTVEQVITIAEMGKVLSIPALVAINNINVINGKPTVAPQLMLALIRRSGLLADLKIEDDGSTCTVTMTRKGESPHVEKFSMTDAAAMGLAGKDNWRKQPAVMRKWRAISAACRVVFPDVIWGFYTPEELE